VSGNTNSITWGIDGAGSLYKITNNSWSEAATTWNNRPLETGTLICNLDDPYVGGATSGQWVEVDVSAHFTPGAVNNFVIREEPGQGEAEFRSRESANPPEVVVMRCAGCGCKGATPYVTASSNLSLLALALAAAGFRKPRRTRQESSR